MGGSDRIFGICNWGGRLLTGQIFFQELKAGDGILVFLDNNMLTKLQQPNNLLSLQLMFLKYWRIIQEAFLTKVSEKDTRHRSSCLGVLCRRSQKLCKIHRKTSVLESLF